MGGAHGVVAFSSQLGLRAHSVRPHLAEVDWRACTLYCPFVLRVEREHRFDTSVEDGFAYITDPPNWPEFWPGFVRMEPGSRWNAPGDESTRSSSSWVAKSSFTWS